MTLNTGIVLHFPKALGMRTDVLQSGKVLLLELVSVDLLPTQKIYQNSRGLFHISGSALLCYYLQKKRKKKIKNVNLFLMTKNKKLVIFQCPCLSEFLSHQDWC